MAGDLHNCVVERTKEVKPSMLYHLMKGHSSSKDFSKCRLGSRVLKLVFSIRQLLGRRCLACWKHFIRHLSKPMTRQKRRHRKPGWAPHNLSENSAEVLHAELPWDCRIECDLQAFDLREGLDGPNL